MMSKSNVCKSVCVQAISCFGSQIAPTSKISADLQLTYCHALPVSWAICETCNARQDYDFRRITPSWLFVYNILLPNSCSRYSLHAPIAVHQALSQAPACFRHLLSNKEKEIIYMNSVDVTNADRRYGNKCYSALNNMYILRRSTYLCWNQHLWQWVNANDSGTQNCSFHTHMCCVLDMIGHDRLFILHRRK